MARGPDILVVAPDEQLRRSIAFALEAEGLNVLSRPDLPASVDGFDGAQCSVIDENAIAAGDAWGLLAGLPHPLVLLIDRLPWIPEIHAASALRKPLLGRGLVDAVLAALGMDTDLGETP